MMSDFRILTMGIGIIIGIISLLIFSVYLMDRFILCPNFGEEVELPCKYNFWAGGCFVQLDSGQWIRVDNFHGVNLNQNPK